MKRKCICKLNYIVLIKNALMVLVKSVGRQRNIKGGIDMELNYKSGRVEKGFCETSLVITPIESVMSITKSSHSTNKYIYRKKRR